MGAVVSCIETVAKVIGGAIMAIVHAVGAVCMAIIHGIVAIFTAIINCLTCGKAGRKKNTSVV